MDNKEQKMYYIYRDNKCRYRATESKDKTAKYGDIVNVISCSDESSFIRQCLMYAIPDKSIKYMVAKDLQGLPKSSDLINKINNEEKKLTKELNELLKESNKRVKELNAEIELAKILKKYTNSVSKGKFSQELITFIDRIEFNNKCGGFLDDETLNFIIQVLETDYNVIKKQGFLGWQFENSDDIFKTLRVKHNDKGIVNIKLNEEDYQLTKAKNLGEYSNQITLCAMLTNLMDNTDNISMYYSLLDTETPTCNCLAYDIGIIYQMLKNLSKNQKANLIKGYNNFIKDLDKLNNL